VNIICNLEWPGQIAAGPAQHWRRVKADWPGGMSHRAAQVSTLPITMAVPITVTVSFTVTATVTVPMIAAAGSP
jgi:hypothetical protein